MKNYAEILEAFSQNYDRWLKLSTSRGIQYQKQLTAKQTKWFLDVFNRQTSPDVYHTDVWGTLTLSSGKMIAYRLTRIRHGAGLLNIEEM